MSVIELRGVSRRYEVGGGVVIALEDVDLEVEIGKFIVVLGPSGSGKTTLLNMIGALDTPTDGEITIAEQRVAIARALATGNRVLLADEPTAKLDFHTGIQILELLQDQTHAGITVLIVTHNRELSRCADRVIELSSGRVMTDGPPAGGQVTIAALHW
ncbi:MAG: ATP-binding cassette domain-containing protein [Actinobacteria bacterium]|nr:ATP-binding cassette domain-containing protein [Actinomycetota bacterium]